MRDRISKNRILLFRAGDGPGWPALHQAKALSEKSLLNPRLGAGMFRFAMGVTKIEIAQVNRQGQQILEDAHRIVPVDRKITQRQKRPERATFPKAERNDTLLRALGGDPLKEKTQTENSGAEPTNDFPRRDGEPIDLQPREKMKTIHNGGTLRQIRGCEQLFVGREFPTCQHINYGKLETCLTSI